MNLLRRLIREEEGQGMVEYGLIIALVALLAIGALNALGLRLDEVFRDIVARLVLPTP